MWSLDISLDYISINKGYGYWFNPFYKPNKDIILAKLLPKDDKTGKRAFREIRYEAAVFPVLFLLSPSKL